MIKEFSVELSLSSSFLQMKQEKEGLTTEAQKETFAFFIIHYFTLTLKNVNSLMINQRRSTIGSMKDVFN